MNISQTTRRRGVGLSSATHPSARKRWFAGGLIFLSVNVKQMPNDGELVDLFAAFCDDDALRRKVLVDNPTRLYWPESA